MTSGLNGNYVQAAVQGESAIVAHSPVSTRNQALNRAAFNLGTIPDMPTETAINALLIASRANGYLKEHGDIATRKVIDSGLRNGQANLRPSLRRNTNKPIARQTDVPAHQTASKYPVLTKPDANGKPAFLR